MGGSVSRSRPAVLELTPEDKILQQIAVESGQVQLGALRNTSEFSQFFNQKARTAVEGLTFRSPNDVSNLVRQSSDAAIALLRADINEQSGEALEQLRASLAPTLGLRSTDSTVLSKGSDIVSAGVDAFGRSATAIRGAAAQQELSLGVEQDQTRIALAEAAGQLGLGIGAPGPIAASVETVRKPKVPGNIEKSAGGGLFTGG